MGKRAITCVATLVLAGLVPVALAAAPTHKDVRYSKEYERSVMDIWTVKSDKPAPLVVMFHGGGFKMGDKSHYHKHPLVRKYHAKGVAFATVNYPFLEHTKNNYRAIMEHTVEAIEFLGNNAKKYNIDPKRISVMGSSAGALISCYLGYGSKMPIRSVYAHQQPMGTPLFIGSILRKGCPPTVVYNTSPPTDKVHNPDNAKFIHDRCKKVGVYCEMYGSKQSGLPTVPEGQNIDDIVMKVFYKSWQLPHPDGK